jgi:hypothetical protein
MRLVVGHDLMLAARRGQELILPADRNGEPILLALIVER